ncbi:hypothetical protein BDZ97DRAFT_2077161 [Flammula alnicola]|nr:hypothetical protein BDZ97DRAFT_2077161 [Flammula alnicola]
MLAVASKLVTLLDHFTLHGPNGTHSVLVMDVVVSLLSLDPVNAPYLGGKLPHLHLGNVGLPIPQLADHDPHDVMTDLSSYDLTVFLPVAPANQTPSLPAYVVMPCNITTRLPPPKFTAGVRFLKSWNHPLTSWAGDEVTWTLSTRSKCAALYA